MENFSTTYASPIGTLVLTGENEHLLTLEFSPDSVTKKGNHYVLKECVSQLNAYFEGKLETFNLPLQTFGTEFQKKVWEQLTKIPFGKTISYLELSRYIGDEKSIRAVGTSNGKNPIPLIIPCHRVIGSNGKLVGYSGELWRKKWLLQHEMKFKKDPYSLF